jgi:hypothetical protein
LTGARGDVNRQAINRPVLDTAGEQPASGSPFANLVWPSPQPQPNPSGYLVQIQGGDKPTWRGLGLIGLRPDFQNVTNIGFTINYTLFLTWQMPAYFGASGNIIYTLAVRQWSAVVLANKGANAMFVNRILAGSGVFSPGEFVADHRNPILIGPNANYAQWIN